MKKLKDDRAGLRLQVRFDLEVAEKELRPRINREVKVR